MTTTLSVHNVVSITEESRKLKTKIGFILVKTFTVTDSNGRRTEFDIYGDIDSELIISRIKNEGDNDENKTCCSEL